MDLLFDGDVHFREILWYKYYIMAKRFESP